ncbi:MAG TPA: hypothetical protein VN253_03020 [Kofleriaceae bacterium]|nr:hypothetical protein [Kofleriaceae bacterium]
MGASTQPLLSDAQFGALLAALVTFLGSVLATAKWAVNRVVKAIDDSTAARAGDIAAIAELRAALIELRGVVQEGRNDIRELRAIAERLAPLERPRVPTSPVGVPRLRHADDPDPDR